MFCPQCGQRNPDQSRFCAQCGSALPASMAPASPAGGAPPAPPAYGDAFAPPPPPSFDNGPASPMPAYNQAPSYGPPPPPAPAAPSWGPPPPPAAGPAPAYAPGAYAAGYAAAPAMEYKGVMPRLVAMILDGILTFVAYAALSFILGGEIDFEALASGEATYGAEGTPMLLAIVVGWGYPILFEGLFGGTIGKLILGLRVVNAEGGNAGLGRAIVRNLLRIIDALPFMYLLGAILVSSSDTKQRLGDRVAGTYVVAR